MTAPTDEEANEKCPSVKMANLTDGRMNSHTVTAYHGPAHQQQYQPIVAPRAHLADRRPIAPVASAACYATTSLPSDEYQPHNLTSSYNQPVVGHQHQNSHHHDMSYPKIPLGGASLHDDYNMASTGKGYQDPAFAGGLYGSSLIGNEGQLYGPSLTQNLSMHPQGLHESRSFSVPLTEQLVWAVGHQSLEVLNYFGRSPNPRVSLVITHGVPHEPHDLRLQLATGNRLMGPATRSGSAPRPQTPKRTIQDIADDSNYTSLPDMKRRRSDSGKFTRVAGLAELASDDEPREDIRPVTNGRSYSFQHTKSSKKVSKIRVKEVADASSDDEDSTKCNIPGFRNDSTYTAATRHLHGWGPRNLPPVCGQIIVSTGHKRYSMMRNDNDKLVYGPQEDVLMEIDDDFPNQISSAQEDTWQVGTLMALYPDVPISQFRARMIWDRKGVSALNNRLSAFRESNGMFSILKSCQRAAPTVELDIVHKLSTDQLNRNTGWRLSPCKTMMTQPEVKNGNWYPVPVPSADFLSTPQAQRLNDTLAKLNRCIQHIQDHNLPVNKENIHSVVQPANRGQKKSKKRGVAIALPYLPESPKGKKAVENKADAEDDEGDETYND